jgi:site-specific recombinase XerD
MARKPKPVANVYEKNAGSGIWYIRYRIDGKLVRKKVGNHQQATNQVTILQGIRASDPTIIPSSAKQPIRTAAEVAAAKTAESNVLLSQLCDGLLGHIQTHPHDYRDQHNPPIRIKRIADAMGDRVAATIRPSEIEGWLDSLTIAARGLPVSKIRKPSKKPKKEPSKLSPASWNRYRTVFSAIYRWGKRNDKIEVNPVRDVPAKAIGKKNIRWLDSKEEAAVREVLQGDVDNCGPGHEQLRKRLQHHIYELDIGLGTGMRRSEMYSLTWDQVNFHRKRIQLTRAKNGDDRLVILNSDVVAAFRGLRGIPMVRKSRRASKPNQAPADSVFSLGDNHRWLQSALKRAGVPKFRWHDSRHTFCSRLAQQEVPIKTIQVLAGHKSILTTAKYAHLDDKSLTKAVELLTHEHPQA